MTNQFCGTVYYMSPEILQKQAYNPKAADIWSLGIVLYKLLYNKYPFYGRDEFSLLQKIKKTKLAFMSTMNLDLKALL